MTTYRKTTITITVLSDSDEEPDFDDIAYLAWAVNEGPCVALDQIAASQIVDEATMAALLTEAGSEPGFFSIGEGDAP